MPTKREMIENTRKKLAEFAALPHEEQKRRMIAWGTINEKGEVLMGGDGDATEEAERPGTNGAVVSKSDALAAPRTARCHDPQTSKP